MFTLIANVSLEWYPCADGELFEVLRGVESPIADHERPIDRFNSWLQNGLAGNLLKIIVQPPPLTLKFKYQNQTKTKATTKVLTSVFGQLPKSLMRRSTTITIGRSFLNLLSSSTTRSNVVERSNHTQPNITKNRIESNQIKSNQIRNGNGNIDQK